MCETDQSIEINLAKVKLNISTKTRLLGEVYIPISQIKIKKGDEHHIKPKDHNSFENRRHYSIFKECDESCPLNHDHFYYTEGKVIYI